MKASTVMQTMHLPVSKSLHFIIASLFLTMAVQAVEILITPRLICEVAETATSTTLSTRVKGCDEPVIFRIDWTSKEGKPENFAVSKSKQGTVISTYRLGKTTITRTIVASAVTDCVMLHVIADQPGRVNLSARYASEGSVKINDRRELLLSGEKISAHAWIIPYESDVQADGDATIVLPGEGEALILLNLTIDPKTAPISETFTRLGAKYDPGHNPPSPQLIWEGVNP